MNFLYFSYQLMATFFLVMAGIAVANYITFDLSNLLEESLTESSLDWTNPSESLYYRLKFGLMMWVGAIVISAIVTYSQRLPLYYPLLVGLGAALLILLLFKISGELFAQRWVTTAFGEQRRAYLINFLLCMLASYWLFRRSSQIAKATPISSTPFRDDILDAGL